MCTGTLWSCGRLDAYFGELYYLYTVDAVHKDPLTVHASTMGVLCLLTAYGQWWQYRAGKR